jgi:hypothetical protein
MIEKVISIYSLRDNKQQTTTQRKRKKEREKGSWLLLPEFYIGSWVNIVSSSER